MDYRKFLGATKTEILPYLGGLSVHAADRRLRVTERVAVGWWHFEIKGRNATPKDEAEAPDLDRVPAVRGHMVGDWLFSGGNTAVRLHIMPEEQPPVLSPATGRRWAGGNVLFDSLAFEDEAEDSARTALLADETIGGLKGATPSLRAAFGYALVLRKARTRGMQVSPREVLAQIHAVSDGTLTADTLLDELEARVYQVDPASPHRETVAEAPEPEALVERPDLTEERAAIVLAAAGADLLDGRYLGDRNFEVVFRYRDERFIAVVDWETLHVYDAGICLDGTDEMLGLDSLPSVIAEAMDTGVLYITRRR